MWWSFTYGGILEKRNMELWAKFRIASYRSCFVLSVISWFKFILSYFNLEWIRKIFSYSMSALSYLKEGYNQSSYAAKRVFFSTGNAAWITATTFLILIFPLIVELDRENLTVEMEK